MARIDPRPREELPELEQLFRSQETAMGYVTNGTLTMGRRPELLKRFRA